MALADHILRELVSRAPDSSPESYLLPTRPARRPAPYASDTLTGVTPLSGLRLISVCIQPSPRARRSVGVVERDGSRFLRPDLPPGRLPLGQELGLSGALVPVFSSGSNCRPGRPLLFTLRCPIICLQLDAHLTMPHHLSTARHLLNQP